MESTSPSVTQEPRSRALPASTIWVRLSEPTHPTSRRGTALSPIRSRTPISAKHLIWGSRNDAAGWPLPSRLSISLFLYPHANKRRWRYHVAVPVDKQQQFLR